MAALTNINEFIENTQLEFVEEELNSGSSFFNIGRPAASNALELWGTKTKLGKVGIGRGDVNAPGAKTYVDIGRENTINKKKLVENNAPIVAGSDSIGASKALTLQGPQEAALLNPIGRNYATWFRRDFSERMKDVYIGVALATHAEGGNLLTDFDTTANIFDIIRATGKGFLAAGKYNQVGLDTERWNEGRVEAIKSTSTGGYFNLIRDADGDDIAYTVSNVTFWNLGNVASLFTDGANIIVPILKRGALVWALKTSGYDTIAVDEKKSIPGGQVQLTTTYFGAVGVHGWDFDAALPNAATDVEAVSHDQTTLRAAGSWSKKLLAGQEDTDSGMIVGTFNAA